VGTALGRALDADGHQVVGFDVATVPHDDVRDASRLGQAVRGCDGVIHLAAVSRVAWAHADPERCWSVNVGGVENLLAALTAQQWVLFASSREVYGNPARLPATEDAAMRPLNVYARAKIEGERLVREHPRQAIVRLSNAYGPVADHADRVVPAFARAAARGGSVRVDGAGRTFDFVHLDDVVTGVYALVRRLASGDELPPVHLTTGVGTSLGRLAELATRHGATAASPGVERDYDVERFVGDPARAEALLGWRPTVSIDQGFARLVADLRREAATA